MLILKRKQGQAIDVGEDVRIILHEIHGGHVKIGIVAPMKIKVKRSEIAREIQEENRKAALSQCDSDLLNEITQTGGVFHSKKRRKD